MGLGLGPVGGDSGRQGFGIAPLVDRLDLVVVLAGVVFGDDFRRPFPPRKPVWACHHWISVFATADPGSRTRARNRTTIPDTRNCFVRTMISPPVGLGGLMKSNLFTASPYSLLQGYEG